MNIPRDSYIQSVIYTTHDNDFKWRLGQEVGKLIITEIKIDEARAYHDGIYRVIVMASLDGGAEYQWKDYPYGQNTALEWAVGE